MKKLFTLFLALVASVGTMYASNTQVDGIWYDFNESNKTAIVTYRGDFSNSYTSEYSDSVVIPSSVTYNGTTYTVTSIGAGAFYECYLTSVTIPNSVTGIGHDAFYKCFFLTSVTIPNGVTWIGEEAFWGCYSLKAVTIPNSVTSIGKRAFEYCSSLTSVTINSDAIVNKVYSSSFNLSDIFGSQVTEYMIGDNVKGIGIYAFYYCSSLTSVTIPNSVTSIGKSAFSKLTSVTLTASSEEDFCKGQGNSLLYTAGVRCRREIQINGNIVTDFTIPNGVTSIGEYAFYGCSSLTSITIPNSVTSIGGGAFYECSSLTSITIPNSVTSIGGDAFYGCSSLTSITIPNSVTSIGNGAFYGCDKLVDVYCYATTPPAIGSEDTFSNYNAFLYVPCESKKAYMVDAVWGNFKYIECISSEGIEDISSSSLQGGDRGRLILRDGQIYILRNGKTYTMQGQEVK